MKVDKFLVKAAYAKIKEEDAKYHGITDNAIKFLMLSSRHYFGYEKCTLTFDLNELKPTIYVTPVVTVTKKDSYIGILTWLKTRFKLKLRQVEKDLPIYLGLMCKVKFARKPPKGKNDRLSGKAASGDNA